ncbi:hypothetical protein O6P43_027999 [Quillaja saponaria]|uniref:Uncharacterized protein n=1 Tax=Quillaja saponaria TaxID=32244 RepID=A0AAD7L5Y1_QUISA|nr:hypothetical protein O6P43_027999 [Quillaja saponaria]
MPIFPGYRGGLGGEAGRRPDRSNNQNGHKFHNEGVQNLEGVINQNGHVAGFDAKIFIFTNCTINAPKCWNYNEAQKSWNSTRHEAKNTEREAEDTDKDREHTRQDMESLRFLPKQKSENFLQHKLDLTESKALYKLSQMEEDQKNYSCLSSGGIR